MEDCNILTLKQAVSMTRYSFAWARLHCNDADFPKMFHVFDARQKYMYRDEWLEWCKKHSIDIIRKAV